ncbi:DUF3622 domain-containing protein [Photobacterium chitinilyticum]|uniref:DUF3622 domain-containing protein n=1 Tax=Photobacterium chitinilyticum TaxID=2485123 RepID=A0A444JJC4_9GAMM|nr:DUF3622 domain-containing protein [Photobacterium chitinilyticum]RWX53154.1 DUF3622 domain-containing protein [Photobacterium chitinilyticum]
MANGKKFDYRVVEKRNGWAAEIIRQISARRTTISKREMGFATEAEATEWAEKTLAEFVQNQIERNKRKALQRSANEAKEEAADLD